MRDPHANDINDFRQIICITTPVPRNVMNIHNLTLNTVLQRAPGVCVWRSDPHTPSAPNKANTCFSDSVSEVSRGPYPVDVEKAKSSRRCYMEEMRFVYLSLEWKTASVVAEDCATPAQKTGCNNKHGW